MSYTTVIGGKLKLKNAAVNPTTGSAKNSSTTSSEVGHKQPISSGFSSLAPPRLPISQPYAPGEREEMSKGYLKNAFARETSALPTNTNDNLTGGSDNKQSEKGSSNQGDIGTSVYVESSSSSSSSTSISNSRKRGRSEEEGYKSALATTTTNTNTARDEKGQGEQRERRGGDDNELPGTKSLSLLKSSSESQEVVRSTTASSSSSSSSSNKHQQSLQTKTSSESLPHPDQQKTSSSKTAAQLRFEEAQAKRLHERAKKEAQKSHREKIEDLNKLLETMPEHYDLFRISYGGQG
jgi:protein FAM32A